MINSVVGRGKGVDMSARGLDLGSDRADRAAGGALENHVFVDVGCAGDVRGFVRTAGFDPYLDRDNRREMILLNDDAQAVVEGEKQPIS
jgi:hypothetical protein